MEFADLSEEEQNSLRKFYKILGNNNDRRMEYMARESSVQLIYQNGLVLYQFVNPPLIELDYHSVRDVSR
mgnify:CR=1 FL=1